MKKLTIFLLTFISIAAFSRPLVLISIDGFTPKYLELYQPPFLTKLASEGAFSEHMKPVFPSKTFPNHLTLVTGVYPQNHGIIHNSFYHPTINRRYSYGSGKDDSRWVTSKPIWTLAEQQGLKAATFFWPESEGKVDGILPTYMKPYDGKVTNQTRLNQIIDWLSLPPETQPQFISTYFSTVDSAGHNYGIHSEQAKKAVLALDSQLADFYQRLVEKGLSDVDIIVLSDHGMMALDKDKAMVIDDFKLPKGLNHVIDGQTQLLIYDDDPALIEQTKQQLLAAADGRYVVYTKGHYPAHWHMEKDRLRIPDLIASANAPYSFVTKPKDFQSGATLKVSHSTHGFDPSTTPDMDAMFIAFGPSFAQTKLNGFDNLDVMPLMLKLLDIPAPTHLDGSVHSLEHILK